MDLNDKLYVITQRVELKKLKPREAVKEICDLLRVSLRSGDLKLCDVDDCEELMYCPTEAGDLCEKHYDDYFQALDNASRC